MQASAILSPSKAAPGTPGAAFAVVQLAWRVGLHNCAAKGDYQGMNPAEQLAQDYLSRLSAAARGRLAAGDRRALVSRTLDFIERSTGPLRSISALEVGKLLAGLGDPAAIVDQEQARLATARGEVAPVSAGGVRVTRMLRRQPGQASWHWPSLPATSPELAGLLMAVADEQPPARPAGGQALIGKITMPARLHPHRGRTEGQHAPEVLRLVVTDESGGLSARLPARPSWPSVVARDVGEEDEDAAAGPSWLVGRAESLVVWITGRFRTQPVESVAAVLLGIGGAAFPPIWVLGAAVALASRVWNYRDKWAGLGLPVLLTVVGTVAGICLTASHATLSHDAHDGYVSADMLSRVMALLGASYLVWRASPERRRPVVPSWARTRKIS